MEPAGIPPSLAGKPGLTLAGDGTTNAARAAA
jgi:hypothetical protein